MLALPRKSADVALRPLRRETDHVDHDIVILLLTQTLENVQIASIAVDLPNVSRQPILPLPPVHHCHIRLPRQQMLHNSRADQSCAADDEDTHLFAYNAPTGGNARSEHPCPLLRATCRRLIMTRTMPATPSLWSRITSRSICRASNAPSERSSWPSE